MKFIKSKRLLSTVATAFLLLSSSVALLAMSRRRWKSTVLEEGRARSKLDGTLGQLADDLAKLNRGWDKFFEAHGPLAAKAQASKDKVLADLKHRLEILKQRSSQTARPAGVFAPIVAERSLKTLGDLQAQAESLAAALRRQADDLRRMQALGTRRKSSRPRGNL